MNKYKRHKAYIKSALMEGNAKGRFKKNTMEPFPKSQEYHEHSKHRIILKLFPLWTKIPQKLNKFV